MKRPGFELEPLDPGLFFCPEFPVATTPVFELFSYLNRETIHMVIILKHDIHADDKAHLRTFLESRSLKVREIVGDEETIFGVVGHVGIDCREVELLPGVSRVIPITKPYKMASREMKKVDTVVSVGPVRIGGLRIAVIAGPCAVESRGQIMEIAAMVRESGAVMLRGGAFKPRSSPYAFQGLGEEGLRYLKEAGEANGLPVVTEIVAGEDAAMMKDYVDVFQIGARNMQNFHLLKKVGALGKPVILKRGLAGTIEEWLMASEYLMAHGTNDVILCERGIRTYETATRNTLDLSAVPVVKKLSHLPIIVDPSHATGFREKVPPMALAAIAAGADGLIIEVHQNPDKALSDGPQSLYPQQFEKLMRDIEALSVVVGKEMERLPAQPQTVVGRAPELQSSAVQAAFQGERGAYSDIAARKFFGDTAEPLPRPNFKAVFDAVLSGNAEFGIVPVENSLTGSIHENFDLLLHFPDIKIVGETILRIEHNLIAMPGVTMAEIKRVYSHPQGLAQCAEFLDTLTVERIPFADTAGSVARIAREGIRENAAIASAEAARIYKMAILKQGVETNPSNYTRFVVLARIEKADLDRPDKASLVFAAADKPGSLFRILQIFADKKLNLKKIESRPIHGQPWKYMFYVDIELPEDRSVFDQCLALLRDETDDMRVLGTYRSR
jgi:3-deoxy-7-phosphoheptulonate synthase